LISRKSITTMNSRVASSSATATTLRRVNFRLPFFIAFSDVRRVREHTHHISFTECSGSLGAKSPYAKNRPKDVSGRRKMASFAAPKRFDFAPTNDQLSALAKMPSRLISILGRELPPIPENGADLLKSAKDAFWRLEKVFFWRNLRIRMSTKQLHTLHT
jgi:hypothetical protein